MQRTTACQTQYLDHVREVAWVNEEGWKLARPRSQVHLSTRTASTTAGIPAPPADRAAAPRPPAPPADCDVILNTHGKRPDDSGRCVTRWHPQTFKLMSNSRCRQRPGTRPARGARMEVRRSAAVTGSPAADADGVGARPRLVTAAGHGRGDDW
jgi:hypothetical protein